MYLSPWQPTGVLLFSFNTLQPGDQLALDTLLEYYYYVFYFSIFNNKLLLNTLCYLVVADVLLIYCFRFAPTFTKLPGAFVGIVASTVFE